MKTPKISVITVSYNSERTITDTIKSVIKQSNLDFEYIIVDGASNDNTLSIIRSYETLFKEKNIKFKWISEPDKGIYDAMNKGVKLASGEFVAFLNSDDWYDLDAISEVIGFHKENVDSDIIYGNITMVSENDDYIKKEPKKLKSLLKGQWIYFPSVFIKKELLNVEEAFDTNYKLASDYKFLLSSYLNNKKFKYINKNLSYYRLGGSTTKQIYTSWREVMVISTDLGVNKYFAKWSYYEKVVKRHILRLLNRI